MPSTVKQEIMPYIIGGKMPDKNIIDSKALIELVAEHGGEKGLGYIDAKAALKFLMSSNKGIANSEMDLSGHSKICKDEYMQLANLMPKVIFGYDRLDSSEMSMYYGLKLRKDVAERLRKTVRPVPGYNYALESKAMVTMGVGFSIGDAVSWASDVSKKLANAPYQCDGLRELNGVLSEAEQASNMIPSVANKIEGLIGIIDSFDPNQPMATTGMVALKSGDIGGLLAVVKTFVPGMKQFNLEAGAPPTRLDQKGLGLPVAVYAARSETMIGGAVGDAKEKLPKLLASQAPNDGPFFVMNYNYESLKGIMEAQGDVSLSSKEVAEILNNLGDMIFEMRASKSGVVMRSAVLIK
jgi:hypothetical protein